MKKITIFTPTYNRKRLLPRLYNSLNNQTNKKFIWMIIDDGSTDNTKDYIDKIKKNSNITIEYYLKANGGKHTAHNMAIEKCETDYFLTVDSDDILSLDAIEKIYSYLSILDNNNNLCGLIGNCFDLRTKNVIGTKIPNVKFSSGLELYQKKNFKGDTIRVYKTKILKKNLFPVIENEKFMPENVIYDKIDCFYKFLVVKDKLYYAEYQANGYSSNISKIRHENPMSYSLSLLSSANSSVTFRKKINLLILYIIWCNCYQIKVDFKRIKHKFLFFIACPIAIILKIFRMPDFLFESVKVEDE